jgi:hypothetical protein
MSVYQHLLNRNFWVNESANHWQDPMDHIKFFTPYTGAVSGKDDYTLNPNGGSPLSYLEALSYAVTTWAPARMNQISGPLYLILIDHGSDSQFFLTGFESLYSWDIDMWLNALESQLAEDYPYPVIVVLGSCYSGSFVTQLSRTCGPGDICTDDRRIIISSTASNEVSYRGPLVAGQYRDGEFFVGSLFNKLGQGLNLAESFQKAVELTEIHTDSGYAYSPNLCSSAHVFCSPYYDFARQHPGLDDNADGVAGNNLSLSGDGNTAKKVVLGYGDPVIAPRITEAGKQYPVITPGTTMQIWAKAVSSETDPSKIKVWAEVREPDQTLPSAGSQVITSQIVNLDSVSLSWTGSRYQGMYAFSLPGRYTLFFYAKETSGLIISDPVRVYVYVGDGTSGSPGEFNLLYPPNESNAVRTTVVLDWTDSIDPEGQAVSYTVFLSENAASPPSIQPSIQKDTTRSSLLITDLADGHTYYWEVQAFDEFGASRMSSFTWSFTTNNNNPAEVIVAGTVKSVKTEAPGLPIPNASVIFGSKTMTSDNDGYYQGAVSYSQNYSVTAQAHCYGKVSTTISDVVLGDMIFQDFELSKEVLGNIDDLNCTDLKDAVLAAQVLAGMAPTPVYISGDVNNDGQIGMEELIYILQRVAKQ